MPHVLLDHRHVGKLFRHFRTNRGLTQTQVAKRLWINYKSISRWELGEHDLFTSNLIAVAAIFDYDVVLQKRRRHGARPTGTGWPT